MFIDPKHCLYSSMASLLSNARQSGTHPDAEAPEQTGPDGCISDMLLYVQSNGMVQVGHDELGRMHYLSSSAKRDFALPTLTQESDQLISAHPGMYYQADIAMMLGKLFFSLTLKDGTEIMAGGAGARSCYLDYFLPVTTKNAGLLTVTSTSIAPMLEPEAVSAIPGLPLPGPSGAVHALHVKNNSGKTVDFTAHLHFNQHLISQYQFTYTSMKEHIRYPFKSEWHQNALLLWRPDVSALIQAQGFSHSGNPGMPALTRKYSLAPGEETTLHCYIAISSDIADIHPAMAALYRHTALEWINLTAAFWADRLGRLSVPIGQDVQKKAVDFHMRSILDNFNCYHLDASGELVAHLQGAPSQIGGRFWGIDAEPTALSLIYAIPELAGPVLRYVAYRNKPVYSLYPDHSTPIMMAPLIIAAKYFELTGDVSIMREDILLKARMLEDARFLLSLLHESGLLPSRYSSDGHVFNRYDFGTNCKAYYVFSSFRHVLAALGEEDLANQFAAAGEKLKSAVYQYMVAEGPFGRQISGGANMGEHEVFYLRDDLMYYDGEDSSSCMAWLYGLADLRDPLFQNYHRFARSLFATNYDAEVKALRWFAWGHSLDATAYVSAMAGNASREGMLGAFTDMLAMTTDTTGAMFWWPRARNYVRGLTRCSQAQGAYVFQNTEQWLGLKINEHEGTITISPQGFFDSYHWQGARLGKAWLDIELTEQGVMLSCRLTNKRSKAYKVSLHGRQPGALYADGSVITGVLPAGGVLSLSLPLTGQAPELREPDIELIENLAYASHGPNLGTYLYELPRAYDAVPEVVILPLVLLTGPSALTDLILRAETEGELQLKPKSRMLLDDVATGFDTAVTLNLGPADANKRIPQSLYVKLPQKYKRSECWLTRADFVSLRQPQAGKVLAIQSDRARTIGSIKAKLSWRDETGAQNESTIEIPVNTMSAEEFGRMKVSIFGGRHHALSTRLQ